MRINLEQLGHFLFRPDKINGPQKMRKNVAFFLQYGHS